MSYHKELERVADELKRIGDLLEAQLLATSPEYKRTGKIRTGPPKMVGVSVPTVEHWNDKWRETHPDTNEPTDEG